MDMFCYHLESCYSRFRQVLLAALGRARHGNVVASRHRKPAALLTSRLAEYVVGSLNTTGVGFIKTMTPEERHAELVYTVSLFEKVQISILFDQMLDNWL